MKKRSIITILALTALMGIAVTGCDNSKKQETTQSSTTQEATSEQTSTEETLGGETYHSKGSYESLTFKTDGTAAYMLDPEAMEEGYSGECKLSRWFGDGTAESMIYAAMEMIANGNASINGEVLPGSTESEVTDSFIILNEKLSEEGKFVNIEVTNDVVKMDVRDNK